MVAGQPLQPAFEVFQRVWGSRPDPLLITLAVVSGLAQPDFLLELEAVASSLTERRSRRGQRRLGGPARYASVRASPRP